MKFDIIIGNPPWNKERTSFTGTTAGKSTLRKKPKNYKLDK